MAKPKFIDKANLELALSENNQKLIENIQANDVANSIVSEHNISTESHNDIRLLITELTNRLNALANSDDTTLDQMSELVAYIKANRELIESVTTNKVNVSDIIDNLTTNVANKPLSAAQGVAIKSLVDALETALDTHTSDSTIHVTSAERTNWNDANDKKHSHSNKTILDGITSALVTAWNNASTHITDTVKHITANERTLWNTVSSKADSTHTHTKTDVGLSNVPNVATNDQTPTFTTATTRANITSGEKLSITLGKISKFFTDLKTVAFTGSYNDLSNKPTLGTSSSKAILTATAPVSTNYNASTATTLIPDVALLSYWNGAYTDAGSSNLEYCKLGKFGAAAVKGFDTVATSGSVNLITSGAVYTALAGKANASHGTHVSFVATAPAMNGTASAGSATTVSRSDHVHPVDTSRAAANHSHDAATQSVAGLMSASDKKKLDDIPSDVLSTTGNASSTIANFTDIDTVQTPTTFTSMNFMRAGTTLNAIFGTVATAVRNVRRLINVMGETDISDIGDGTVTGAMSELKKSVADGKQSLVNTISNTSDNYGGSGIEVVAPSLTSNSTFAEFCTAIDSLGQDLAIENSANMWSTVENIILAGFTSAVIDNHCDNTWIVDISSTSTYDEAYDNMDGLLSEAYDIGKQAYGTMRYRSVLPNPPTIGNYVIYDTTANHSIEGRDQNHFIVDLVFTHRGYEYEFSHAFSIEDIWANGDAVHFVDSVAGTKVLEIYVDYMGQISVLNYAASSISEIAFTSYEVDMLIVDADYGTDDIGTNDGGSINSFIVPF